ncbi:MAG: alcohol dehydrogenase catalytic domain-containing protein [Promethearchaeota archaeon]|jgi:alcohol dehydrogenase
MKAAVFDGQDISIREVPIPKLGESQVLIKIKMSGICGTDIAIVKGDLPTPTPIILGHEFTGEVIEAGKKGNSNWEGKHIASEINTNIDFSCYYCQRKIFSQCASRKALGIDIDGSFAEYIVLEPYLLHGIPRNITYKEATFIEPLAAAYQTFEMMPLSDDDKVIAIYGLGKLGLLLTQVALVKGLDVIAVDGSDKKLSLAEKYGAKQLINRFEVENIIDEIKGSTDNLGADIVVDTTGNPEALIDIVASCKTRGKLHIKSTHGVRAPINLTDIVVREITVYSSRCGPFDKAIEGLSSGDIKVKNLISKVYDLENIRDAFDAYENPDFIKAVIVV